MAFNVTDFFAARGETVREPDTAPDPYPTQLAQMMSLAPAKNDSTGLVVPYDGVRSRINSR